MKKISGSRRLCMKKKEDEFKVEVKVTYEEYKEIQKNFPYQFWKHFLITLVVILSLFLIAYYDEPSELIESIGAVIFLSICAFGILKLIEVLFRKHNYKKLFQKGTNGIHYTLFFYDDYLEKKSEQLSQKAFYQQIQRIEETNTHIFILIDKENILPIRKDTCTEEEIQKIRKISISGKEELENKEKLEDYLNPHQKYKGMRKFLIFLFVLTILSIFIAFIVQDMIAYMNLPSYVIEYFPNVKVYLSSFYAEVPYAPMLDYLWGAWLVLPIPLLSIILGIKYKRKGIKCRKNIVAGSIFAILLLLLGSMAFIYPVKREYSDIFKYQEVLGVTLPKKGKLFQLELDKSGHLQLSYVLWKKDEDKSFYNDIKENKNWLLKSEIDLGFKDSIQKCESKNEECYYSIYIEETKEYNQVPEVRWNYHIYSMMYDPEIHSLKIGRFPYTLGPNN